MESDKIEILLEKYFQGETSIVEENELKNYFSSLNVAQHLEQYKPMFGYFSLAKEQQFEQQVPLQTKKRNVAWLSIAASVVVLLGIGTYAYVNSNNVVQNQSLGTYDDPEVAFRETQKALALLSGQVNKGIESVQYVQEYEDSKNLIFKQ
ncbi:MAG TPA: hypothetical protein VK476_02985 [Flavobacterium sp.]|nr:hypothetical protein [Flavobacterium sp.]